METNYYLLILFILHICCGIFWAGVALMLNFYILPAIKKSGPDGGKFMQNIIGTNKFPTVVTLAMTITIIAGLLLVHQLSNGFEAWWFKSKMGMVISLGGTCGITAFLFAFFINRPSGNRVNAIGAEIAKNGGVPTEEQAAEMMALRNKIVKATHIVAWLILVTIVCMASAEHV